MKMTEPCGGEKRLCLASGGRKLWYGLWLLAVAWSFSAGPAFAAANYRDLLARAQQKYFAGDREVAVALLGEADSAARTPRERIRIAEAALLLGCTAEARTIVAAVLDAPAPPPAAIFLAALFAEQDGNDTAAAAYLRRCLDAPGLAGAEEGGARVRLAACEARLGRAATALALLEPLLESGPDRIPALLLAARLRAAGGDGERGRALLREAGKTISPATVVAIRAVVREVIDSPALAAAAGEVLSRVASRARGYDRVLITRVRTALLQAVARPHAAMLTPALAGSNSAGASTGRLRLPLARETAAPAWQLAAEGEFKAALAAIGETVAAGSEPDDARFLRVWLASGNTRPDPAVIWFALAMLEKAAGNYASAAALAELVAIDYPGLTVLTEFAITPPAAAVAGGPPAPGTAVATLGLTLVIILACAIFALRHRRGQVNR